MACRLGDPPAVSCSSQHRLSFDVVFQGAENIPFYWSVDENSGSMLSCVVFSRLSVVFFASVVDRQSPALFSLRNFKRSKTTLKPRTTMGGPVGECREGREAWVMAHCHRHRDHSDGRTMSRRRPHTHNRTATTITPTLVDGGVETFGRPIEYQLRAARDPRRPDGKVAPSAAAATRL